VEKQSSGSVVDGNKSLPYKIKKHHSGGKNFCFLK
jgi:hypothetical protein